MFYTTINLILTITHKDIILQFIALLYNQAWNVVMQRLKIYLRRMTDFNAKEE